MTFSYAADSSTPQHPSANFMPFNDGMTQLGGDLKVVGEILHTLHWEFYRHTYERYRERCEAIAAKGEYRIPPLIHMIWLGSKPSEECLKNLASWKKFHPDWEVKLWTEREIEDIIPQMMCVRHYQDSHSTLEQKSLIARYNIMRLFGGLYVEPDYECLGSYKFLHQSCDFYAGLCQHDPSKIDPSLFGCVKGHIVPTMCAGTIDISCVRDRKDSVQVDRRLGCGHFTRFFVRSLMSDMPPLKPTFYEKGNPEKVTHYEKKYSRKHHGKKSQKNSSRHRPEVDLLRKLGGSFFNQSAFDLSTPSVQESLPNPFGEVTVLPPAIVNPYLEQCVRFSSQYYSTQRGIKLINRKNALSIRHWNTPFLHKPISISYCADYLEVSARAAEEGPSAKIWRRIMNAYENGVQ